MRLPDLLAKPVFRLIYPLIRRRQGTPRPPLQRRVTLPDPARRRAFDDLWAATLARTPNAVIDYSLPYPKIEFAAYLGDWCEVAFHGTVLPGLDVLQPLRRSSDVTEFGNRQQIFCTPDAYWATWFAILDRSRYRRTRNGCIRLGSGAQRLKFYHFELETHLEAAPPFVDGWLYFVRPGDFPARHQLSELQVFGAEFEEWGSPEPVTPLARLALTPADFVYLDQVQYSL